MGVAMWGRGKTERTKGAPRERGRKQRAARKAGAGRGRAARRDVAPIRPKACDAMPRLAKGGMTADVPPMQLRRTMRERVDPIKVCNEMREATKGSKATGGGATPATGKGAAKGTANANKSSNKGGKSK